VKPPFERIFSYQNPNSLVNQLRKRRFQLVLDSFPKMPKGKVLRILDLGGTYRFWRALDDMLPEAIEITLVDLKTPRIPEDDSRFRTIEGDVNSLKFDFSNYDFIFSNSLIEHLGSRSAMESFARMVRSSGLPYSVQTPSKWFPLEPHCRIPLFQFLPRRVRAFLIWKFKITYFPAKASYEECLAVSDSTILLTKNQFQQLFPDARVVTEILWGLPKSYSAFFDRS